MKSNLLSWFELHEPMGLLGAPCNLRPHHNAAPAQDIAAVRAVDGERRLAMLQGADPRLGAMWIST